MADRKLVLLLGLTALVILGMVVEPSRQEPSLLRHIMVDVGQVLIILVAAWIGIDGARFFSFRSALGKALLYISLGLLSWGVGSLMWVYFLLSKNTAVPYPSVADIAYLGSTALVVFGLFTLLKSLKMRLDTLTFIKVSVIPAIMLALSYALFIHGKLGEQVAPLEKAFNVLYPVGTSVTFSLALVMISLVIGGILFQPLSVLSLGFIALSLGDLAFSFTTASGTYFNGSWVSALYCIAFMIIGIGMYQVHAGHRKFLQGMRDEAEKRNEKRNKKR